jgi:PAS domain S-box-containing protein/diguanylate cyclase (GGDEF)-like protein
MANTKASQKILRVLILDDSPDDAEQASNVLRQAGYMLKTQRLETGVAVEQTLESGSWDLILCAHGVAGLPARQLTELVARQYPFLPVIVLTRRVQDDELHTLMRAGARDVIVKGQWGRLAPVVERELAVAAEHRAFHEVREAMRQLEVRYRTMIETSFEAISYLQDGMHMDANPAYLRLFGYETLDALKEIPLLNLIEKSDQARFKAALRKPEGAEKTQEFMVVTSDGNRLAVEVAMAPLTINGEPCVQLVATDISKRKALETKLQSMHQRDALTGLYNRPYFLNALDASLKAPGGVLLGITVNHLAELNQAHGHAALDRMLAQLAKQLRELGGNDALVARIAGGQFAVLLNAKASAGADVLAGKIGNALATLTIDENGQRSKPDIMLTPFRLDGQIKDRQGIMDQVFKAETQPVAVRNTPQAEAAPAAPAETAADTRALLRKNSGPAAAAKTDWHKEVQQALAHNKMQLQFQPIINLHGESRCLYEAQLMLHADNRLVAASEYLPSAEAAGLGSKLDRVLMMNVIDTLSKFQIEGRSGIAFAHLTAAAVQDNALLAAVQMHIRATGLDAGDLILQIDEAVLGRHMSTARDFIQRAKALGAGILIDDFTGQVVNLDVLAALDIDFVAVDCGPSGLTEDVLYGAIDAARALDKMVIARHIEDGEIFSTLFSRGVHYVQGDYLQPASSGLDYSFEVEQTLASDEPVPPSWRATG